MLVANVGWIAAKEAALSIAVNNRLACESKDSDIIKFLLERGVDVNAKDSAGKTAMIYAKEKRRTDFVELLKAAGAAQ